MKIIKRPDSTWSYKHTCKQCTAELEVEKGDVKHHSYNGDQREPGYETWQATCPVCSSAFDIPINVIPKIVQIEIKNGLPSAGTTYGGPFDR
jgi:hypothetical protein